MSDQDIRQILAAIARLETKVDALKEADTQAEKKTDAVVNEIKTVDRRVNWLTLAYVALAALAFGVSPWIGPFAK